MGDNRCIEPGCMLNVEYECPCTSPLIYTCKMHVLNHMEVPNKDHALKSISVELSVKTREAILLPKCDSSINEDFNSKFKEEEKVQKNFRNISAEENLEVENSIILESSKSSELERKLKGICSACESNSSISEASIMQYYQEIVSTHHQKPSLFNILKRFGRTNLLIYNTEIESQTSIILDTSQPIGQGTCITQLPNGKLFCFGNYPYSGITLVIDENYRVQELSSGTACMDSSATYFDNNIYCFGGYNKNSLALSSRFDLERNQWNELTPLPKVDSLCNSIIFNGSILVSGYVNKNLLRYSIVGNYFSTIPYDFAERKVKILINAERLYLIECDNGSIYESEVGSDTAWRQIANNSTINFIPEQTYCQCNKEEIYIGCFDRGSNFYCFKFHLNEKRIAQVVKNSALQMI